MVKKKLMKNLKPFLAKMKPTVTEISWVLQEVKE